MSLHVPSPGPPLPLTHARVFYGATRRLHVSHVSWQQTTFTTGRQTHGGPSSRLLRKLLSTLLRRRSYTAGSLYLCECPCSAASTPGLLRPVMGLFMAGPAWPQAYAHPQQSPAVPQELLGEHC